MNAVSFFWSMDLRILFVITLMVSVACFFCYHFDGAIIDYDYVGSLLVYLMLPIYIHTLDNTGKDPPLMSSSSRTRVLKSYVIGI